MPCHTRMKRIMRGLLWLFLLEFGCLMVMSLEPGYLDFDNLPDTNFSCVGKVIGGYYADLETNCQMFHVCTIGQLDEPMDIRFLCLNGTVFDQETRVCERIDEVDCSKSEQFYSLNLELYGNTQPPLLEEDFPVEIKRSSSTTTTTTTTTQRPSNPKSSSQPYYTTSVPPTTTRTGTKVITSHHFPVVSAPDIRFNPEEINISLNPGAPPDITRSQVPISFQQQSYSNSEKNTRVTVTTHTTIYKNDKPHRVPLLPTINTPSQILVEHEHVDRPKLDETTQAPKSVVSYGLTHNQGLQAATPTEINYGFTYQQTEESLDYQTEVPPHPYQYQINIANLRPPTAPEHPYHSYHTSSKRPHKVNFPVPTTYRNHPAYTSVRASSSQQQQQQQLQQQQQQQQQHEEFQSQRTEKPPRLQLPLPLLPTLPPLTFSSPAPFTLGRHIETKRYTNDHQSPPRIIISASASVSDNSGRRLNYSLGTIGASHLLGPSPSTYDEYKEDDVSLDPFYHDVPKIKSLRHKRSALGEEDIINDQEAADLLKFLFNWYSKREKMRKSSIPVTSEDITEINEELAPISEVSTSTEEDYSNLFEKAKNITEPKTENNLEAASVNQEIQFFKNNNSELEQLAQMLEMLNVTSKNVEDESKEDKKHTEVLQLPLVNNNNATALNKTDLVKNEQQVSVPSVKVKTSKQGRNHRRRPSTSRTTPRRPAKPNPKIKTNNRRVSNTPYVSQVSEETKSYEAQSKNLRRNSSRSDNIVTENIELLKSDLPRKVNKDEKKKNIVLNQSENLQDVESSKATTPGTEAPLTASELDHAILGNISEDVHKYERIKHEDLSKIYKLLGEEEPVNSLSQLYPKHAENDTDEVVETHESKQLEHIITTHENFIQFENSSTENFTTETPITSENISLETTTSEYYNGSESYTTEISNNLKEEEHSTEVVNENLEKEDELKITTTNDPEYVSTTIESIRENLQAQSSSYRNKDNHQEEEEEDEENDKHQNVEAVENDKIEEKESTDKPNYESNNNEYEKETQTPIETFSEENDKDINLFRTDKTPEEQELEEATLHIDLLNLENNPEINDEKEFANTKSGTPTEEIADKVTEITEIDITTLHAEQENIQENNDKTKDLTRRRLVLPRNDFKVANRRVQTYHEFPINSKQSAISFYKSRTEEHKRKNNYIRNRKFIDNPSPSKNIENQNTAKVQPKENYEKVNRKEEEPEISEAHHEERIGEEEALTEENPIIPDYVDDNYEPLTYNESPKLKEFENFITTTYGNQDFEGNTVTDDIQHFNTLADLHDHTSTKSDEEVQNTTTSSKDNDESNTNHEDKIEIITTTLDDHIRSTTTKANYELLTEATTSSAYAQDLTTENIEEQTTELSTTHFPTQTIEITTFPTTTEVIDVIYTSTESATTSIPETTTSPPSTEYVQTTNANTETTIDLLKGSVFTTDYPTEESTMIYETTQATSVAPSSTSDSTRRISSLTEPEEQVASTTPMGDGSTNKYQHLKTRLPWYKRQDNAKRKEHSRHRFTTNTRRVGIRERTKLENKITHVLNNLNRSNNNNSRNSADKLLVDRNRNVNINNTAKLSDIEPVVNFTTTNINNSNSNTLELKHELNPLEVITIKTADLIETTMIPEEQPGTTMPTELERSNSGEVKVDIPVTDAPLLKSANPTKAKYTKIVFTTTPLSKFVRVELRKDMHGRRYSFNCFNRKIHKFYSDARDCRLFHYCTLGYTKNQMVDMKFVCDAGTYFDDEKLICTKVKPARCL